MIVFLFLATQAIAIPQKEGIDIYSGPGTFHSVIRRSKPGDTFRFITVQDGWCTILLEDSTLGYVRKRDVTVFILRRTEEIEEARAKPEIKKGVFRRLAENIAQRGPYPIKAVYGIIIFIALVCIFLIVLLIRILFIKTK